MHCADENDWKLSSCCWAKIRLDQCTECREHCWVQKEPEENLQTKIINHQIRQTQDFMKILFPFMR